eukprot:4577233-Pyramimonas_sp.AAC.1
MASPFSLTNALGPCPARARNSRSFCISLRGARDAIRSFLNAKLVARVVRNVNSDVHSGPRLKSPLDRVGRTLPELYWSATR